MSKQSFTDMAGAKATGDIPKIGVGMLGYAFMGKAHSNAYKTIPYMIYPPPAIPTLQAIAGRTETACDEAARRYGFARYYTRWQDLLEDDRVQLFDNGGPNDMHAEPCIAAAEAGKHILCEKPLGRTAEESRRMLEAVEKAGVKHMVAFNYRFVPAIRLVRELIDSGKLGKIYHWRSAYLQEWFLPSFNTPMTWRADKEVAGSGTLGDLGAHFIDLAHYLLGDIKSVSAMTKTFVKERALADGSLAPVHVDDTFAAAVEFANGAMGTFESTRFAAGRKNYNYFEINAENGSIRFNLERMNELDVYWMDDEPATTRGFHNVLVSEPNHPWWEFWWPGGHMIGWEHTFIHEITHLLDAIVNDRDVAPHGATFLDGYRAAVVCDAILESADRRKHIDINY